MGPQEEFSLLLRSLRNMSKVGCLHGNEARWPRETLIRSAKSFASPICIPWPRKNHASLHSNLSLHPEQQFFMIHNIFKKISKNIYKIFFQLQGREKLQMKLKSELGVAKQLFVSKFRKMHVVFVSKTRNMPTEAVAATAASAIFRLLISTFSPNF